MSRWNKLSLKDRRDYIGAAVQDGIGYDALKEYVNSTTGDEDAATLPESLRKVYSSSRGMSPETRLDYGPQPQLDTTATDPAAHYSTDRYSVSPGKGLNNPNEEIMKEAPVVGINPNKSVYDRIREAFLTAKKVNKPSDV